MWCVGVWVCWYGCVDVGVGVGGGVGGVGVGAGVGYRRECFFDYYFLIFLCFFYF